MLFATVAPIFLVLATILLLGGSFHYLILYMVSAVRSMRGAAMPGVTIFGLFASGVLFWLSLLTLNLAFIAA